MVKTQHTRRQAVACKRRGFFFVNGRCRVVNQLLRDIHAVAAFTQVTFLHDPAHLVELRHRKVVVIRQRELHQSARIPQVQADSFARKMLDNPRKGIADIPVVGDHRPGRIQAQNNVT